VKAIDFDHFGGAEVLRFREVQAPILRPDDLLVRVASAGVNQSDLGYRNGGYGRADFGDSTLMGLEMAGEVVALGRDVTGFSIGDRVMGITGGGAYAELCRIDHRMVLPVPENLDMISAGAVMEAFVTSHEALVHLARLEAGETVLIHAASGGIGSAAVQLAHRLGARVLFTASGRRLDDVRTLGGDVGIDYAEEDFAQVVRRETDGRGVDVVIDFVGSTYFERNIFALTNGGRLVQVGMMGGARNGALPLDVLILRHLRIMGTVMKSRPQEAKRAMVRRFGARWLADLAAGRIKPVIEATYPLSQAAQAQRRMEAGNLLGKILLIP
jgi:putative PIG3 family NAD(P)H quinone oxidoreductase